MKLHRTKRVEFAPLIFFPLLNVALLLIPFIVLGSAFVLHPGVTLSLPNSSFLLSPRTNASFISITGGGVPRVYINDRLTTIRQVPAELAKLDPAQGGLVIRADSGARYEVVFAVADAALKRGFSVALAAGHAAAE